VVPGSMFFFCEFSSAVLIVLLSVTTTAGAFIEYTFSGAAVALFGPVGPNGAPYSVQLDQGSLTNYSSYKRFYRPQTMLFQVSNLASGQHTIRIVSEAWNNSALTLGIDYAEVFTTPSLQKRYVRLIFFYFSRKNIDENLISSTR